MAKNANQPKRDNKKQFVKAIQRNERPYYVAIDITEIAGDDKTVGLLLKNGSRFTTARGRECVAIEKEFSKTFLPTIGGHKFVQGYDGTQLIRKANA